MNIRLKGWQAIDAARAQDLTLSKYADPEEDARSGLSPEEAVRVAREDPALVYVDVQEGDLAEAYLTRAKLTRADLAGADLTEANLAGADLTEANLAGADLTGADLTDAKLRGARLPAAPVVPNIHVAVYEAASAPGGALDMESWHTCDTTHCRAGWVCVLAGEAGRQLEDELGTNAAAALIYMASDPTLERIPDWFAFNSDALADMKRLAGR